jgi:hypothetical protein
MRIDYGFRILDVQCISFIDDFTGDFSNCGSGNSHHDISGPCHHFDLFSSFTALTRELFGLMAYSSPHLHSPPRILSSAGFCLPGVRGDEIPHLPSWLWPEGKMVLRWLDRLSCLNS